MHNIGGDLGKMGLTAGGSGELLVALFLVFNLAIPEVSGGNLNTKESSVPIFRVVGFPLGAGAPLPAIGT